MLLAAALATAVLAQANPLPPAVTTGTADSVTTTSAVVNGTVNPHGAAATYHVEYGTSVSLGLTTPDQSAGAGAQPVAVNVPLAKLTQNTTYHYRVVATNAAGTVGGSDHTLRTARAPAAPLASTRAATQKGPLSAVVNGRVTPRGLATTVHFVFGPTSAYGSQTPDVAVGAGFSAVPVALTLSGLQPNTRYHFRTVATNALGTRSGGDRYFTTAKAPTGVIVTPSTGRVRWGSGLQIAGAVTGQGLVNVALERQDAPYDGPYVQVATTRAASNGVFTFIVPPLWQTARLRVTTLTSPVAVSSDARTVAVALKVGVKTRRLRHDRLRLSGTVWPTVPSGRVSLQRRSRGHWRTLYRARARALTGGRSQFRFTVTRTRSRQSLRAVVAPHDGGRHATGYSRTVSIARKR